MYEIKDVDDLRRVISVIGDDMTLNERSIVMLAPVYRGMVRNCDWGNSATLKKTEGGVEIWTYARIVTVDEYWDEIRRYFLQNYIDCDVIVLDVVLKL